MAESHSENNIAPFFQVPDGAPDSDHENGTLSMFHTECESSARGMHEFLEENGNMNGDMMILQGQEGSDDWSILSVLIFERSDDITCRVSFYTERKIRDQIDNSIEWRLRLPPQTKLDPFWDDQRGIPMYITGSNFNPEVKGIEITVLTPLEGVHITNFEDVKEWAADFFPTGVVTPL